MEKLVKDAVMADISAKTIIGRYYVRVFSFAHLGLTSSEALCNNTVIY